MEHLNTAVLIIGGTCLFWISIMYLLSLLSGWRTLAKRYSAQDEFGGRTWRFKSIRTGFVSYSCCVNFTASDRGLGISVLFPFRFGHPKLLIPWTDLRISTYKHRLGFERTVISFPETSIQINLSSRLTVEIMEEAKPYISSAGQGFATQQSADLSQPQSVGSKAAKNVATTFVVIFFICVILYAALIGILKTSFVYEDSLAIVRQDAELEQILGQPIEPGWIISGSAKASGMGQSIKLSIPISGPKGGGTIKLKANKQGGVWKYSSFIVETEGGVVVIE